MTTKSLKEKNNMSETNGLKENKEVTLKIAIHTNIGCQIKSYKRL